MKRYDFISFYSGHRDIVVESTDEVALDWLANNYSKVKKEEPNHKRITIYVERDLVDLIFWNLVTHFSHTGWEPLQVGRAGVGPIKSIVMRRESNGNGPEPPIDS